MKPIHFFTAVLLLAGISPALAQNSNKPAKLVLGDSTTITGFIKDNIRAKASVLFYTEEGGKKKQYEGSDLLSAEIDGQRYVCINGDFFKVIADGELCLLQKASDASAKPSYNGNEASFTSGTDGKPGDYFICRTTDKALKQVTRKNGEELAAAFFEKKAALAEQVKSSAGNPEKLKVIINEFNTAGK